LLAAYTLRDPIPLIEALEAFKMIEPPRASTEGPSEQ
jgi:hypothetical protein